MVIKLLFLWASFIAYHHKDHAPVPLFNKIKKIKKLIIFRRPFFSGTGFSPSKKSLLDRQTDRLTRK